MNLTRLWVPGKFARAALAHFRFADRLLGTAVRYFTKPGFWTASESPTNRTESSRSREATISEDFSLGERQLRMAPCRGGLFILKLTPCQALLTNKGERVNGWRELDELRRGHDSTGVGAEPTLNTPLLRYESLVIHPCSSRAPQTTQQIKERGEPRGFSLSFSGSSPQLLLGRGATMMVMPLAMPLVAPVMGSSLPGRMFLPTSDY